MDPTWQGGDPSGRGANYNYDRAQRHDHPSSSSQPQFQPLQVLTSYPQLQPRGGYPYGFEQLAVPRPGHPGYRYSESSLAPWTSTTNVIGSQYQPHPDSATVFPAPGNSSSVIPRAPVYRPPGAGVHAQQPGSATVFPAPGNSSSVIPRAPVYRPPGAGVHAQQPGSATVFPEPGNSSSVIPHAPVYPPGAGVYAQQPGSATVFHAAGYNSNPHAFVYQPGAPLYAQPGAATDFSAWGGNANDDPYTSAGLVAPPADANQGASRGPVAGDPNRSRRPALQNVWANDLRGAVQRVRTPADLEAIVYHVMLDQYNNGIPLMEVAAPRHGETALKELVRLAALYLRPDVLQELFRCLVHGWIMEQSNGPDLLQYFFTTLDYVHCSIFIAELALPRFWEMVGTSRFGHMSMVMCLDNAGYTEQGAALQENFVIHTVGNARNIVGSLLLRTFFQTGRNDELRERITERVEANLAELSMDQYGNNVVQACFLPRNWMPLPSAFLLQRGLQAFLRLPGDQLRELVQNHRARYVLRRLLGASHYASVHHAVASAEAIQLAQHILGVGPAGDELDSIARLVIDESKRWLN